MTTPFALPIEFADIKTAAGRLAGVAHRTPVMQSATFNAQTRTQAFFKCENFQRAGAFKFRGAYNALANLSDSQRRAGVVAFSSGNHAQAVALAAQILGVKAVIVMPEDAPTIKLAATRGYGAEVVIYDRYKQDRAELASQLAMERGLSVVPPFDDPAVMAGQGSAALELFEEHGPLDALVVCLGGGGLISGCAVAARELAPNCEVIGVEPASGNDVQQSLARGEIVSIAVPKTIADGAQTQQPGELTFQVIKSLVSRVVTVTDEQLVATMAWLAERMKIVAEPTGCLAAAALLQGQLAELAGARVGIIISGGNIDMSRYCELLARRPKTDHV